MILITSPTTDPAVNLAMEEHLLMQGPEDVFMVWRNRPAVIVGRNQNALAQVNHGFVRKNGIQVVRRISGGGAVYHDLGNINFTFIRSQDNFASPGYETYLRPVMDILAALGAEVHLDGQSDIAAGGFKVSGNAQHVLKGRVLHHGTLIFDSDLDALHRALAVDGEIYCDKAVDSIHKKVTNLRPCFSRDMAPVPFMEELATGIQARFRAVRTALGLADLSLVQKLARKKYRSWQWNFARSPRYRFHRRVETTRGPVSVRFRVKKGIIEKVDVRADFLDDQTRQSLNKAISGNRHRHDDLAGIFADNSPFCDAADRFLASLF